MLPGHLLPFDHSSQLERFERVEHLELLTSDSYSLSLCPLPFSPPTSSAAILQSNPAKRLLSPMNYKYLFLSLMTTGLIAFISSFPNHSLPGDGSLADQILSNLAHIPAYALLTFLWLKTFDTRKNTTQLHKFPASQLPTGPFSVLSGLVLFAVSDEIHQSFIPGRTASCVDVGLNIVGILIGFGIFSAKGGFHFLPFIWKGGNLTKENPANPVNPVYMNRDISVR